MRRSCTLNDIALRCGVSKSTVAQIMRDPSGCKASLKTREYVIAMARSLDYHPNYMARALSTNRSNTIGIMFPAMHSFYDDLSHSLTRVLEAKGYYGIMGNWNIREKSQEAFRAAFQRMKLRGVDGIITCEYDESLADNPLPVVTYGNERAMMDCVYPDKEDYAVRAINYLREKGHSKIAFCGVLADKRYKVFRRTMRELNLPIEPRWFVNVPAVVEFGYSMVKQVFTGDNIPTAIVSHSDCMSQSMICALNELGLRVPEDVSILSYDNMHFAEYCTPPLTTFDQNFDLAADLLVQTILQRIENPELPQQKQTYIMSLVERKSVATLKKEN